MSEHPHKKPKFNPRNPTLLNDTTEDPDEDPDSVLDLDEIGVGARKTRRGAVKVDVYESDSDEDVVAATKKDVGIDDDDDMFGDSDKEKEKKSEEGGKKKVNFIKLEEIAGQEFGSGGEGSGSEDSDGEDAIPDMGIPNDDDPLDDEKALPRASKKDPKITGFNLKDDMEEGAFDEDLNFVRKTKDAEAVHDNWLVGIHKSDIKKAKEASEAREKARLEKEEAERKIPTHKVLTDLILCLERGETPLEALARLQSAKRKRNAGATKSWREKRKLKKTAASSGGGDMEMKEAPDFAEAKPETEEEKVDRLRVELVEKITEAADRLLTRGQREIYEETREALMRQYSRLTGDEWNEPQKEKASEEEEVSDWEYRWTDGRDDGQIYGPYPAETMKAWEEHGFFAGPIEFRRAGSGDGGWSGVPGFSL